MDGLPSRGIGSCAWETDMARRVRGNRGAAFKVKVALEAVRGEKPLNELAQQFDLHANQIKQ